MGISGRSSERLRNGCCVGSSVFSGGAFFSVLRVDVSCDLHPFFAHKLDAGRVRLVTIAHAFNYRVAVLRNGVKSAIWVGRFLTDTNISWGHQLAVMFQIISTLALEVPTFLQNIDDLRGVSPNVQLYCEPWGCQLWLSIFGSDGFLCA